jgi:hypothetical protein
MPPGVRCLTAHACLGFRRVPFDVRCLTATKKREAATGSFWPRTMSQHDTTMTHQLPAFSKWFVDTACWRDAGIMPPAPIPLNPANLFTSLLRILDIAMRSGHPVTRMGLEHALDSVFTLPQLTSILDDPTPYQNAFAARDLPACDVRFAPFWHHIIRPAWDQHAEIRSVCVATASP